MAISENQIDLAQTYQHDAAHDENTKVRLVAGPGTGKSYAIGERVRWLLAKGVQPESIYAISFTNAASEKLRDMINIYCKKYDQSGFGRISVSTLHSLGLKSLRKAGQLNFPVDPVVLDDFESKEIFDKEFSKIYAKTPSRSGKIREDFEAFSSTGKYEPVSYIPPDPPITQNERKNYKIFHYPRTLLYSCILPGEIVRICVDRMNKGLLNPKKLLDIKYLIVDEYQDFNPSDIEFIDWLSNNGSITFVAGDDDQSIYSFRHATPEGIQTFLDENDPGNHELPYCFRCTKNVLHAGQYLIKEFSQPERIPKKLSSLYSSSDPINPGATYLWKFSSATSEARHIAQCCSNLIESGLPPEEIMILLCYTDLQLQDLIPEFEDLNIPFCRPKENKFIDTNLGRFILSIIRIICNPNDYVAYRILLGLLPGVGIVTCNNIASRILNSSYKYRDIFEGDTTNHNFSGRELNAIRRIKNILKTTSELSKDSTFIEFHDYIGNIITQLFGADGIEFWEEITLDFPEQMNLKEIRDYVIKSGKEERIALLQEVYERIGVEAPASCVIEDSIKFLTMHGAKGLDSKVVFIPGLEEQLFPGPKRRKYPGLVLESARMLYVSITRARAACFLSFSTSRVLHGVFKKTKPSRFVNHLGLRAVYREDPVGFSKRELVNITKFIEWL